MNNNDILIRIRYAFNFKNGQMVKIFKLGGAEVSEEEVALMLKKQDDIFKDEEDSSDDQLTCNNKLLDAFLNGLIVFKRGVQENKPATPQNPIKITHRNVNNIVLKKLKIALALTSDDIHEILGLAGIKISNGELSAVLRREGQKNYKECGDRYLRNFLKGLALKNKGQRV